MVGVDAPSLRADPRAILRHAAPGEAERVREGFEAARLTGAAFSCAFRLDHPRGGARQLLLSAQPADLGDGVTGWYANLLDITRQAETEARAAHAAEEVAELNQRLAILADSAPAALYEFRVDEDGRAEFPFFTARMPELMGLRPEAVSADGRSVFDAVHPDDLPKVEAETERSRLTMQRFSQTFRTRDGERWLSATAQPVRQEGGAVRWFGFMFDATERIEAERRAAEADDALRRAHARFLLMAEHAPGAIFELRLGEDGRLRFKFFSPRLEELLGIPRDRLRRAAGAAFDTIPPGDRAEVAAAVAAAMEAGAPTAFRHRVLHPALGERWIHVSLSPNGRDDDGVIAYGNAIDVTDDIRRETELREAHALAERMRRENERQALHDGLTGLPNRRSYDRETERRAAAGDRAGTIVRIDLDYFKSVNDTLGHEAGDAVLQRVADVLRACLGPRDFAARIGGDEFSLLPDPARALDDVCALIERVRTELAPPFFFEGRQCRFGASFGIARTEDMTREAADLPVFADAALYRAKALGRNRLELFTPELRRDILEERQLAVELHEALERDAFEPWFQPQFSARDHGLVGVETLLRWRRPDGRVLTPESFMHVAAQLRIVPEIDRIMMLKAGAALTRWREAGVTVPKISFNVSSGRMQDPDVVDLAKQVAGQGVRVTFELLESILVEEESDAFRFHLDKVREAGIEIEIDDFGSGHASIIGLMQIAPTALKIDRRIVTPVAREARSRKLVRAIVEIAETLGIGTVAEGVETAEQARILREMGCDVLQGFHFSRPLDEAKLAEAARGWRVRAA
ncbi:EAL domain-containing protein [Rhodovulum sp. DZ06]|uniref:sensor domain-containing protein n=1 Tax=Rhodovulum sp. DZ06 TaxID=3425126 RepID=UPI003D329A58